jgi:hypothetical protein
MDVLPCYSFSFFVIQRDLTTASSNYSASGRAQRIVVYFGLFYATIIWGNRYIGMDVPKKVLSFRSADHKQKQIVKHWMEITPHFSDFSCQRETNVLQKSLPVNYHVLALGANTEAELQTIEQLTNRNSI